MEKNLKGKVRKFTETAYSASGAKGMVEKHALIWKNITLFDKDGNEMEEVKYMYDTLLGTKITYEYDQEGSLLERSEYRMLDSHKTKRYTYTFNRKGLETDCNEYLYFTRDKLVDCFYQRIGTSS